jgi:hypothetical protein
LPAKPTPRNVNLGSRRFYVQQRAGHPQLDGLPLFQPSAATGLTEKIVDGAAAYLSGATDQDMRRNRAKRLFQNLFAMVKGHKG